MQIPAIVHLGAVVFVCLLIAGCGTTPPPTAAPTSQFPTLSGPVVRRTLPPTWTPTPSPRPSATPTLTHTPEPTGTVNAAEICDALTADVGIEPGAIVRYSDPFVLNVALPLPDTSVELRFTGEDGSTNTFGVPGGRGGSFLLIFENLLPQPGPYTWALVVISPQYGDICAQSGAFTIRPLSPLRGEFGRLATWVATDFVPFTPTPTPAPTRETED